MKLTNVTKILWNPEGSVYPAQKYSFNELSHSHSTHSRHVTRHTCVHTHVNMVSNPKYKPTRNPKYKPTRMETYGSSKK